MSGGLQFDEETSRKLETIYLTPEVASLRGRLLNDVIIRKARRNDASPMLQAGARRVSQPPVPKC
jgi:hypothetical protein